MMQDAAMADADTFGFLPDTPLVPFKETDVVCQRNSEALVKDWPQPPDLEDAVDDVYLLALSFRTLDPEDAHERETWWTQMDASGSQLEVAALPRRGDEVVRMAVEAQPSGHWQVSGDLTVVFSSLRGLLDEHIGTIPKRNLAALPGKCTWDVHAPLPEAAAVPAEIAAVNDEHLLKTLTDQNYLVPVPFQAALPHIRAYWCQRCDDRLLCYHAQLRKWCAVFPFHELCVVCTSFATLITGLKTHCTAAGCRSSTAARRGAHRGD